MTKYKNPFADKKHYHEHTEWIDAHLSTFFDDKQISVFHEIPTLDLHLDVFFIKSEDSEFNILLTSGMSTLKMNVSEQAENPEDLAFAELMMLIPKSIEFSDIYSGENKNDWIISVLKKTAKFPHFYDTWIGIGHSIQAEEDLTPYGNDTNYVGALILPSVTFGPDFTEIIKDGKKINIYSVFPLYKNEMKYKIENGYNKLLDFLIKADSKEVLDLNRTNLVSNNN
jgi:hypothetical protein